MAITSTQSIVPSTNQGNQSSTAILKRRDSITNWYLGPVTCNITANELAKRAFEEAIQYFNTQLTKNEHQRIQINPQNGISEVLSTVLQAQQRYHNSSSSSKKKAQKWLERFSTYLSHYSAVLDTLAQHHPEYVALAWGTVKFIFVGILNHAELVSQFSKALAKIGQALPRAEFYLGLYPTPEMQKAISSMYAYIIKFLQDSLKWYNSGPASRFASSFIKPFELGFKDTVEQIEECSTAVETLANIAQKAETRDIHRGVELSRVENAASTEALKLLMLQQFGKLGQDHLTSYMMIEQLFQQKFLDIDAKMDLILKQIIVSQTLVDRIDGPPTPLTHLNASQLADALQELMIGPNADDTLQSCLSIAARRQRTLGSGNDQSQLFEDLHRWAFSSTSSLLIINAGIRSESRAKDVVSKVINTLRASNNHVIWHLSSPSSQNVLLKVESLLQYLVYQALKLNAEEACKKLNHIGLEGLRKPLSVDEWIDLFSLILEGLPKLYIVIEAEPLLRRHETAQAHMQVFLKCFKDLVSRAQSRAQQLKVLVISYGAVVKPANSSLLSITTNSTQPYDEIVSTLRIQSGIIRGPRRARVIRRGTGRQTDSDFRDWKSFQRKLASVHNS